MAKSAKTNGPSVLTANDLLSGAIVYWRAETGWTEAIDQATPALDAAGREALAAKGASEEAANRVVGAYLMALDPITETPVLMRERQRLAGPSFDIATAR